MKIMIWGRGGGRKKIKEIKKVEIRKWLKIGYGQRFHHHRDAIAIKTYLLPMVTVDPSDGAHERAVLINNDKRANLNIFGLYRVCINM